MYKRILLTGLFVLSPAAFACVPGAAGSGPQGDPNCMAPILTDPGYFGYPLGGAPDNGGYYPSAGSAPKVVYLPSKYGAIVGNPKTGLWDSAFGLKSKRAAVKEAIRKCEGPNGDNAPCEVYLTYRNSCAAIADGTMNDKKVMYPDAAETAQEAERLALKYCSDRGASDCKIVMPAECSLP